MNPILRLAATTFVLILAATPAHAGLLALEFQGVAAPPSSLGSTSFVGDSFTIQADFDPTTGTNIVQGVASYAVTSIDVTVGGTSYTVTDQSEFTIYLVDATNQVAPGIYQLQLYNNSSEMALVPTYTSSSSAFSARDPSPTVFSGYTSAYFFGSLTTFSTPAGFLTISYDPNVGVGASINAVPEPSSLVLCGIGGSIGLVVAWRRRKRAA
jgi:hypothetical protein